MKEYYFLKKILTVLFIVCAFSQAFLLTGCNSPTQGDLGTIYTVSREDGSGTRTAFTELFGLVLKDDSGGMKDLTTKESLVVNKTDVMISSIEFGRSSIGYVSLGSLNGRVKALSIEGAAPTTENVRSKIYPVSRTFILALNSSASELARDFISFVLSQEGQSVVSENYAEAVSDPQPYSGTKPSGSIVITGSSSVAPVVEKLAEVYKAVNPSASLEIQATDSTGGLSALIGDTCDIAMSSRDLKSSEKAQLQDFSVAVDGIAVIVNNDNPVSNLSREQVRSIFDGSVTNWSEII